MSRIAYRCIVVSFVAVSPAFAAPLDLAPDVAQSPAAPPARYAAVDGLNLGGGFLEMLFRGPATPQYQPPPYRPEPVMSPEPAPAAHPPFGRPQPGMIEREQDYLQPQAVERARPEVNPRFLRQEVNYDGREKPGTVIINTKERLLYLVKGDGKAMRYGIGVGRPGFTWAGSHAITSKREWPDWRPPPEMIKRQPGLPKHMEGGINNPLGARALYIGSTLYRIHGTNEPWSIGTNVSSGCIRMVNDDVIDLYERVKIGAKVIVL